MKRNIVSASFAIAISATTAFGQNNGNSSQATATPAASAIGLKDAYAGKFLIGTAADLPRGFSDAELANIKANYNVVTPENCMKPQIHTTEESWNWAAADALVQWAEQNNIKVWGHNLCWHSQTANWFFRGPNGGRVTAELAEERLKTHILTEAGRYKGKVWGWDVVNEAIDDRNNNGQPDNLRNDSWYSVIGSNYLTMAFKWAHEADPNAQLYYNDYNIEQGAARGGGKHAASMSLLKRMIADGAPINGVGIQGHWSLTTSLADVEKAITDYQSLGLKVAISELDVTISGGNTGALTGGGGGGRGAAGGAGLGAPFTADQSTQFTTGMTAAQADLTALQDKLTAAQKDVMSAVLAKSDDATVQSKLEALANIQTDISMLRYTKAVNKVAATITDSEKSDINAAPGQTYFALFGGNPPPPTFGGRGGGGRGGRGGGTASPEQLQAQAQFYAKLFDIFKRHSDTITRVTLWGIDDPRSWKSGQLPLVFDGQLRPKPAYQALIDVGLGKSATPQ